MKKDSFKKKRRQLVEELTKETIHKAVLELIGEIGVQDLTVSSVAERAGMAKGTVYLYFKDKEELVCSTVATSLDPLFSQLMEILDSDLKPENKLREYARFSMHFFDEYRNTFRVLLYNQHQVHIRKGRFTSTHYQQFLERLAEVIRKGIKEKTFRKIDPDIAATVFMESTIAVTVQSILTENKRDINTDADSLIDILLNGLILNPAKS